MVKSEAAADVRPQGTNCLAPEPPPSFSQRGPRKELVLKLLMEVADGTVPITARRGNPHQPICQRRRLVGRRVGHARPRSSSARPSAIFAIIDRE